MQLPLAHLDASVIEEVPVLLWRRVFEAVGWPASLVSKKKTFEHADVLHAFEHDDPTDELLQAVEALHGLGTEAGREAIMTAMNDRRVLPEGLPAGVGERELALHLFLAQRTNAAMAEVFARAQAEVQERAAHRRYNEFMGKDARAVGDLTLKRDALLAETARYCKANDLGEHVHVRAFEDDGVYVLQVIRSHRTKRPLAVVPGRSARATIQYRPVHGDILRYDASVGRLRIAARAASVVEFYRRILGRVLFDDEFFFTGDPVCDLRVLQQHGRGALDRHKIPGIGRVRMTECLWERGDRDLLHIRSNDCFRNIEELRLPLAEGELLQVKLKLEVAGPSTRPVTVNIRVPSRIEVTNKAHEQLIDDYLTAIGIRNAKERSADLDLWSLYPWRHPAAVWKVVFGAATDSLVRRKVLVPVQLESVPSPGHAGAGRVLAAQQVPAGFYGMSKVPEIPSRSLSSTDLDGLELNPEQLRLHLRSELGLSEASVSWDGRELLDLGLLKLGNHQFRLTYALRPPPVGVGARMRERAAAGVYPVLLIPTARDVGYELSTVTLGDGLPSLGAVTRGVIAACGLTDAVPAVFVAPENARLVVDTNIGKVWVDGVEISGIRSGTHPFTFVEALARACPGPVSTESLTARLSNSRGDGDTTARQAKSAARKSIDKAIAAAGRAINEDLFPTGGTGSYRCAVFAHVV